MAKQSARHFGTKIGKAAPVGRGASKAPMGQGTRPVPAIPASRQAKNRGGHSGRVPKKRKTMSGPVAGGY